MEIRPERATDYAAISEVTEQAFLDQEHSSQTEARIITGLREAGALTVSLVAEDGGEVIGHIAFSPVQIEGHEGKWFGLGPFSVRPDKQEHGVGQALMERGLEALREHDADGCVVLGDPEYYGRYGFTRKLGLTYPFGPPEAFQLLHFQGPRPEGEVAYHPAFNVK